MRERDDIDFLLYEEMREREIEKGEEGIKRVERK